MVKLGAAGLASPARSLDMTSLEGIRAAFDRAVVLARRPGFEARAQAIFEGCAVALRLVEVTQLDGEVRELKRLLAARAGGAK